MKIKKILAVVLATFSVFSLASCGGDKENTCNHVWTEWERVSSPTCDTVGKKTRTCTLDASHKEEADIAVLQHNFGNQGICSVCNAKAVLPDEDPNPIFVDPLTLPANKTGVTADPFQWYQCTEGYYEFTVNSVSKSTEAWAVFSVKEAGQYALYSIENPNNVKIERFDASSHYIPIDENNNYTGFAGRTLEDGNFISTVNCGNAYYSSEWRATFRFSGKKGSTVKVRFVKIAEPLWQPLYIHTDVQATEINGKTAPNGPDGFVPTPVEYTSEYFFDETIGYYRLGTKANPGDIIYVAITATPNRLLSNSFVGADNAGGNNLSVKVGENADGNYLMSNYSTMINFNAEQTNTDNCYANFVNQDGYYPATKELYEFLNYYVQKNQPLDTDIPEEDWLNHANYLWLTACYTYTEQEKGTEHNPYVIETAGDITISTKAYDYVYYNVQYGGYNELNGAPVDVAVTLTWPSNITIEIDGVEIANGDTITFNAAAGKILKISETDGLEISFTLTLTEVEIELDEEE